MIVDGVKYEHISPHRKGYRISKYIDGEPIYFGHFESLKEAVAYREKLKENNWDKSMIKRYGKNYHATIDGAWAITKGDHGDVHYGTYPSEKVAKQVTEFLKEHDWDKSLLEEYIRENNIPTGRYSRHSYITKRKDGYHIMKTINGKKEHFATFKTYEECLPIVEELMACGWDKSRVQEFKDKYNVSIDDNKQHEVYKGITLVNGNYVIRKFEDGGVFTYYNSKDLTKVMMERDALVNSDWDVDLWVEQEDHYTYVPELLPEFNKNRRIPGLKYITRQKDTFYTVKAKMKDIGRMQQVGRYKTLGEAQQVSFIVQKHNLIYEDIIDELNARGIGTSLKNARDKSLKYIYIRRNNGVEHYQIVKYINRKAVVSCTVHDLDEAKKIRDYLVENDWRKECLEEL